MLFFAHHFVHLVTLALAREFHPGRVQLHQHALTLERERTASRRGTASRPPLLRRGGEGAKERGDVIGEVGEQPTIACVNPRVML